MTCKMSITGDNQNDQVCVSYWLSKLFHYLFHFKNRFYPDLNQFREDKKLIKIGFDNVVQTENSVPSALSYPTASAPNLHEADINSSNQKPKTVI